MQSDNDALHLVLKELHSIKSILCNLLDKKEIPLDFNAPIDLKLNQEKSRRPHRQTDIRKDEWTTVTSRRPTSKRRVAPLHDSTENNWISENPFQNLQFTNNEDTDINSRLYKGFEDDHISTTEPRDTDFKEHISSNFNLLILFHPLLIPTIFPRRLISCYHQATDVPT